MQEITEKIKEIIEKFYSQRWNLKDFLTEDDVRCLLFSKLKANLRNYHKISIHAEIRWYGGGSNSRNKLKYRSDIVIIDKTDLQINNNNFPLPSKGYGFNNYYAIIEIKLRRPNNKNSDNKYNEIIQKDIDKLREIKERTSQYSSIENKKYFMLAFDKRRNKKLFFDIDMDQEINWINW